MWLTLKCDGTPESVQIVTNTGEVIERVRSYSLTRKGPKEPDELTITVQVPNRVIREFLESRPQREPVQEAFANGSPVPLSPEQAVDVRKMLEKAHGPGALRRG